MDEDQDELLFTPEDCDECGCPAGDFGKEDYINGCWQCPECGAVQ